jgi:peptidoglycan DL-endopeptidase CwlO
MRAFVIAAAAALMSTSATARAQSQSNTDKSASQGSAQSSASTSPSSSSQSSSSATPSTSSQSSATRSQSSDSSSMAQTPPSSQSSTSQSSSSQMGTSATSSTELSGVLKKVDKDKRKISISSATGGEQELKISQNATITRDGSQAALDQLKEGEQVRASFDPSSKEATKLEIQSSGSDQPKSDKSETKSKSDSKKY